LNGSTRVEPFEKEVYINLFGWYTGDMFPEDKIRSEKLIKELKSQNLFGKEFGIAVIDLNKKETEIFGCNLDHFMYPASVYKIFIGAEVLRQAELGNFSLDHKIEVVSLNDVDKDSNVFPGDSRPLLSIGDSVTVETLLDLMLTRSDNSSSNILIDLVGRESITKNIIHAYGWQGSEVTRKFLDRIKEAKPYRFSDVTLSCVRHVAEFFYLVEREKMVSAFVSKKMKDYMGRWNRGGRKGAFIPDYTKYYRKGGYLENNLYAPFSGSYYKSGFALFTATRGIASLIKNIFTKGWAFIKWVNDAGVVCDSQSHYVLVIFTVNKQLGPYKKSSIQKIAKLVYDFMERED
jgi:hypothetical protein